MSKRVALFQCQECSRKFYTTKSAERAADQGCPGCGGVDIDVAPFVSQAANPPDADQYARVKKMTPGQIMRAERQASEGVGYFGEEKDPLAPRDCAHGNPAGGPCGQCDGHGRRVPLAGDRVRVKGTPLVLSVDRTDGMYADLRFDDGLIFGKILLEHLVLVEG